MRISFPGLPAVRPPNRKRSKFGNIYERAIAQHGARVINPYGSTVAAMGLGDIAGLGDVSPIDQFLGNVRGQLSELRSGLTFAAAASGAAAVGVVLLLLTMPRGRKRR